MHRELEGAKAELAAARRQSALAAGQLAALRSGSSISSSPACDGSSPYSSPTRLPAGPGHVTSQMEPATRHFYIHNRNRFRKTRKCN